MEKYGFDAEAGDEFVFFILSPPPVSKAVSGAYTIISVSLKKRERLIFAMPIEFLNKEMQRGKALPLY